MSPATAWTFLLSTVLREAMRELAQSGIGVVLVTHHLSDVIPEIDRVVLMRKGKIQADGPKKIC